MDAVQFLALMVHETTGHDKHSREILNIIAVISATKPINRDSFIPTTWDIDTMKYLWWSWFTDARLEQFQSNGTVRIQGHAWRQCPQASQVSQKT
eukprot:1344760-Amphidinium_carterae.1